MVLKACALFCSAAIALVLLTMYNIDPRHMMLLAILLLGAIVGRTPPLAVVWLPILVVLLLPMNFERGSQPEMNEIMAAQMTVVEDALAADVQAAGADPWDNTLAYTYDDGVFHGYLYAVPDGMGIEFDKTATCGMPKTRSIPAMSCAATAPAWRNACWPKTGRSLSPPRIWSFISAVERMYTAMQKISYVIPCYRSPAYGGRRGGGNCRHNADDAPV